MAEQKLKTLNYFSYRELETTFQELHTDMHLFYGQFSKAIGL